MERKESREYEVTRRGKRGFVLSLPRDLVERFGLYPKRVRFMAQGNSIIINWENTNEPADRVEQFSN